MFELNTYALILYLSLVMVFLGGIIYLMFYVVLQKIFASNIRSPSRLKQEPVMCGLEYREEELSIPVSKIFADIMKRALPSLHRGIKEGFGTGILNDWFTWMLILLGVVVLLIVLFG